MSETARIVLVCFGLGSGACATTKSPAMADASGTASDESTEAGDASSAAGPMGSTSDASMGSTTDDAAGSTTEVSADTSGGTDAEASSSGGPAPACVAQGESLCGNPASLIHGSVRLPAGMKPMAGDLVVELMHRRYGSPANGGHPHQIWRQANVTVGPDDAVEFDVDMCDANATMWSEENCEYNLVVILDRESNTGLGPGNLAPDVDDPTAVEVFNLSCHAAGPTCFDLELSCLDGGDCVTYEAPPACECAADSCASEAAICQL